MQRTGQSAELSVRGTSIEGHPLAASRRPSVFPRGVSTCLLYIRLVLKRPAWAGRAPCQLSTPGLGIMQGPLKVHTCYRAPDFMLCRLFEATLAMGLGQLVIAVTCRFIRASMLKQNIFHCEDLQGAWTSSSNVADKASRAGWANSPRQLQSFGSGP